FVRSAKKPSQSKSSAQKVSATSPRPKKGEPNPNYTRHYGGKPAKTNNTKEEYPMRLNRFLALRGIATRRAADEMIQAGSVYLNGKKALVGDKVNHPDEDIEIHELGFREKKAFEYVAYYKPRGIITHTPQKKEQDIASISGHPDLFPLGRLDKDSEGLIILTNDGRVTERLLHPRFAHEKEYIVSINTPLTSQMKDALLRGIASEGERLMLKKLVVLDPATLSIILTEGKKHQVRRMLEGVGVHVTRLVRVRIMSIHLGSLKEGESRELKGPARKGFLRELGLPNG
ncbi:MAG: pseudouridine synthase, partial [Patescibacteria group bacterium]